MRVENETSGILDSTAPILWMKVCDPDTTVPDVPAGTDVRVLISHGDRFTALATELEQRRISFRRVGYLLEQECITTVGQAGRLLATVGRSGAGSQSMRSLAGAAAEAARDGFDLIWHDHAPVGTATPAPTPVDQVVPAAWIPFLPHPTLNPAQAEAIPHISGSDGHLIVVAPTGAGKTVVGMAAVLRTVLEQGRKAAWLVPQRSLTNELDRELDSWRKRGLAVERLSGEYRLDAERIRAADLWVTTTEKFEAICRTASLREALATVGCLVVDEIHLIGDPARGSFLEAILTRIRCGDSPIRIVGLSATVANADQISQWLRARTVRAAWRPTRLTWQLPMVANSTDWSLTESAKARLASAIVAMVTGDNGSVLVFCGSKRNVRRMALILAAGRGANVFDVNPDDVAAVQRLCRNTGIGLHYKGWEYKHQAEDDFRKHAIDVLVATSTVAAGVNLPARAVVIADTEVGMKDIDVATVQQMFGRAGRLGTGERDGWAYLLVDETERAIWQRRLLAGFRVNSRIAADPAEHILAEAAQNRIRSRADARRWWAHTLAYHQGNKDMTAIGHAVDSLVEAGFLTAPRPDDDTAEFTITESGLLTARLMVSPAVCHRLAITLSRLPVPDSAAVAERHVIDAVATLVPKLAHAPIGEDTKGLAVELKLSGGIGHDVDAGPGRPGSAGYTPGDLAAAVMLTVANTPELFDNSPRQVSGIPYTDMYPIFDDAPRYLHWLAGQGYPGTIHPWIAIVAADLGRRTRWHRHRPYRGAGRLLWMCEQMATPAHAEQVVPLLWHAARRRGHLTPDWAETGRPRECRLNQSDYNILLRDRATDLSIDRAANSVTLTSTTPATLVVWDDTTHKAARATTARTRLSAPLPETSTAGIAVFTRRGDYQATGWLDQYTHPHPPEDILDAHQAATTTTPG